MIDNAEFNDIGGVFTDMETFIYQSNAILTGRTFRRCDLVIQGGSTLDGCTFSDPSSAVGILADDIGLISNTSFESDGTGYAIELTTDHAGNSYVFDGNTFSEYASANGSTGNEAIFNDSGGHVIINLTNTDSVPSYRNGTSATTAINLTVSLTLTGIVSASEVRIQTARGSAPSGAELYHLENTTGADVVWPYNYSDFGAGYKIDVIIHNVYYDYYRIDDLDLPANNASIPIQQTVDRWYSNPQ